MATLFGTLAFSVMLFGFVYGELILIFRRRDFKAATNIHYVCFTLTIILGLLLAYFDRDPQHLLTFSLIVVFMVNELRVALMYRGRK